MIVALVDWRRNGDCRGGCSRGSRRSSVLAMMASALVTWTFCPLSLDTLSDRSRGTVDLLVALRECGIFPQSRGYFCGHRRRTRVLCRMVNLIRGRCLMAFAKTSRALSRLLPA